MTLDKLVIGQKYVYHVHPQAARFNRDPRWAQNGEVVTLFATPESDPMAVLASVFSMRMFGEQSIGIQRENGEKMAAVPSELSPVSDLGGLG